MQCDCFRATGQLFLNTEYCRPKLNLEVSNFIATKQLPCHCPRITGQGSVRRRRWLRDRPGSRLHSKGSTQWRPTIERSQIIGTCSGYVNDRPSSRAMKRLVRLLRIWPKNIARWLSFLSANYRNNTTKAASVGGLVHTHAVARRRSDLGIADLAARRFDRGMRPQKITFGEMGVRGVLVYCADYHCSHSVALNADRWPDEMRLSDLEPRFVCKVCGRRGAILRGRVRARRDCGARQA
jgi:hypothetical protein